MRFSLSLVLIAFSLPAFAQSPRERAEQLRALVKSSGTVRKAAVAEDYKLPVSRGFHQQETSLCWVYGFLSAQETLHRVKDPSSTLELSRTFLQYHTMQDRMLRHLQGTPGMLKESGTPVDALALTKEHGMVLFADQRDINPIWMGGQYQLVSLRLGNAATDGERESVMLTELERLFGVMPTKTQFGARALTPKELSQEVLGDQEWVSYAPGTQEALGPHPDSDARPGVQSFYTSLENIKRHVYEALKDKRPVTYTANGHVVLIYGGSFDARGKALRFYIKDSYKPFLYTADANKIFKELVEVAMVKP